MVSSSSNGSTVTPAVIPAVTPLVTPLTDCLMSDSTDASTAAIGSQRPPAASWQVSQSSDISIEH